MAEKRMFTKRIIDSDVFLSMPLSTQALYFHLNMNADDEGFVNNPRKIMRMIGSADDDIQILIAKRYILVFESGVIVIKHWKIHNWIRNDRIKETDYQEEKAQLFEKDNGSYSLTAKCQSNVSQLSDKCQHSIDKYSIDKISIDNIDADKPQKHKYGEYKNVLFTNEEYEKLKNEFPDYQERIERLSEYIASKGTKYKNHLATIRSWAKKDKPKTKSYEHNDADDVF